MSHLNTTQSSAHHLPLPSTSLTSALPLLCSLWLACCSLNVSNPISPVSALAGKFLIWGMPSVLSVSASSHSPQWPAYSAILFHPRYGSLPCFITPCSILLIVCLFCCNVNSMYHTDFFIAVSEISRPGPGTRWKLNK